MSAEPGDGGEEFRYGAALAGRIELKWQQTWSEQGTFEVPNPVGALSDGTRLDPARKCYVYGHVPLPVRSRDCMSATRSATSRRTSTRATCA